MKAIGLNSRQRAVMRWFFDKDAPDQSVSERGLMECQRMGLIAIDKDGQMDVTEEGMKLKGDPML